jgi:plastocyanin
MRSRRTPFLAAALAAALALAGAAVAAVVSHGSSATTTIKVTEREYHIALSATSAKAGSVTFVVRNTGKIAHRLSVAGAGLTKPVSTPTIKPGTTRSLTVKLAGGQLSLWCPVPGHAALGMKTALKVAGASATTGGGAYSVPTSTGTDTYVWG